MAAYITVLNYVYSLCVFYYSVLSCVADVADCPLQRLSAIVIKNIFIIIIIIIIITCYSEDFIRLRILRVRSDHLLDEIE